MPLRPCPDCGAPRAGIRCGRCGWADRRATKPPRPDLARQEWQRRSTAAIKAWKAEHGDWCPGWPPTDHAPHATADLTLHHHTDDRDGPASILCRPENSSIGAPT